LRVVVWVCGGGVVVVVVGGEGAGRTGAVCV
jgi:hypothetical protein